MRAMILKFWKYKDIKQDKETHQVYLKFTLKWTCLTVIE